MRDAGAGAAVGGGTPKTMGRELGVRRAESRSLSSARDAAVPDKTPRRRGCAETNDRDAGPSEASDATWGATADIAHTKKKTHDAGEEG